MDSFNIDTVVVGAGVIGLAIARELALKGVEVVVLEEGPAIGSVVSARNSGVIHAGLYYKPGCLKAQFCVVGKDMLYAYAAARGIWHQRCGKLVVATGTDEVEALHALQCNAEQNGVHDLRIISGAEAQALEPELFCIEALHSPSSGMIDVHGLLEAFTFDVTSHGGFVQCRTKFIRAEIQKDGFVVDAEDENASCYLIKCRQLINAAGLNAQKIAASIAGFDPALISEQVLGKGSYFFLEGQKAPFRHLIYPMPIPGSSGLHCRQDINGRTVLGPDLEIVDKIDYRVDPARAKLFFDSVRCYFPKLRLESLMPDYAGIRPKLKHGYDFVVQFAETHKIPGLVNCFGIESPGLTSCIALGKAVEENLRGR